MQGYYRYPVVHQDRVIFVSEDDLWEVPLKGGLARRLTHSSGQISNPAISPDGSKLAYTATEEGATEIFIMDSRGAQPKRLTFDGVSAHVIGFSPDGEQVYFSSQRRSLSRGRAIYEIDAQGGDPRPLALGDGVWFSHEQQGPGRIVGRHSHDLARWKRYRGGLAATIWIDPKGEGQWRRLFDQETAGFARPLWVQDKLWFISDLEGHGNLYSSALDGSNLTRHTDHMGFYVRHISTDGATIVFARAGQLHAYDIASGDERVIEIDYHSPRHNLRHKFTTASRYLEEFALHPKGHYMAICARGKSYSFGLWEGAVRQHGQEQGVRYSISRYMKDGQQLLVLSDEGGEEHLELLKIDGSEPPKVVEVEGCELGRILDIKLNPAQDTILAINNRYELLHIDLTTGQGRVVDRCKHERVQGMSWSSDGRWVAYSKHTSQNTQAIFIADTTDWSTRQITEGAFKDIEPCFDPKGRYLYFISYRDYSPTYGSMFFELSFQAGSRPYLIALRPDVVSPFVQTPRPLSDADGDGDGDDEDGDGDEQEESGESPAEDSSDEAGSDQGDESDETAEATEADDADADADAKEDAEGKEKDKNKPEPIEIDFEGIAQRIQAFPVPEGRYTSLDANAKRIFYTIAHATSAPPSAEDDDDEDEPRTTLRYFDLKKRKSKFFASDVGGFELSADGKTIAFVAEEGMRVVSALEGAPDSEEEATNREAGWIDLGRVQIEVERRAEWGQMLREIWRLMRDQFWDESMSGVDWEAIYQDYEALLDRVGSREEFSDLVWCMQGELGTSHAYEFGGDYPLSPSYRPGYLGADIVWVEELELEGRQARGGYRIERILSADHWSLSSGSALVRPGLDIKEGDVILAINGRPLSRHQGVQERLLRQGGKEVELLIARHGRAEHQRCTVRALRSEGELRYRDWVETRRAIVEEKTQGKVGYLHIPDMGTHGYSEFHRGFAQALDREALIVDVRYNAGGHISQLLIDRLRRQIIGYDIQRHGAPMTYPSEAAHGPLVALTNEYAGSDGDIFSHSFKLYGLGPLIGKRTWGGVIGIWPRHALVDGSVTTQPEFSFWFKDVGFGVENYGTQPDIDIDNPPESEDRQEDPQLEVAIAHALAAVAQRPARAEFGPRPNLSPPKTLPPRRQ